MRDEYGLTHRQRAFADAFIRNGGNASDAARTAGYSEKNAGINAKKVLNVVAVQEYIRSYDDKAKEKAVLTNLEILKMWSDIAKDDTVSMGDRLRASENLGKAKLMFKEALQIEGNVSYIDVLAKARNRVKNQ